MKAMNFYEKLALVLLLIFFVMAITVFGVTLGVATASPMKAELAYANELRIYTDCNESSYYAIDPAFNKEDKDFILYERIR